MRTRRTSLTAIVMTVAGLTPVPAHAHHEAIFGPQSSAVLSPGAFLSAQVFTRENGRADEKTREATTVFSGGLRPLKRPLSVALVIPVTFATSVGGASRHGFEDALVSGRYRVDAEGLAQLLGLDESYVLGVGGLEIPTGTLDHHFGRGPVGGIAAGLFSVEKRPFSVIGYAYYHHAGEYHGDRESGNMFVGLGTAWTPIDDDSTGRLFSVQVGLSHERTFAMEEAGASLPDTGGSGVFVHPGLVVAASSHVQFFTLVSLPVTQRWRSPADHQRFRLGAGTIVILGH